MTKDIYTEVVDRNFCIGCGACAGVQREALGMEWTDEGFFRPVRREGFDGALSPLTLGVCPFADDGMDENRIAENMFAGLADNGWDEHVGYYKKCFIGYCADPSIRGNATSGGIIAWMIRYMLSRKVVDRVIAVGDADRDDRLFAFNVYKSVEELHSPMKSRYYPSEFSAAFQSVMDEPGTVLFVGLPCQIKAFRKIALQVPEAGEKLKYTISVFCGHQKSRHYADYLAMHAGVDPDSMVTIDFRKKRDGFPAGMYGFEITCRDGAVIRKKEGVTRDVFASSWSNNLFMNPACEFCDDLLGETADMSVGDAWLPGYSTDSRGTSIVVARHSALTDIMDHGRESGELFLEETTAETVYRSQESGFRQRREALSYRLALAAKKGRSVPKKRCEPSLTSITSLDRIQQRLRIKLREKSNGIFRRSGTDRDLATFRRKLRILHALSEMIVFFRRIQRRLRRLFGTVFRGGADGK